MPKWPLISKLLQLRISTCVAFVLCLIAVIQLFGYYGVYRYASLPREDLPKELHREIASNLVLKKDKPDCTYDHILQSTKSIHSWDVPTNYDDFLPTGINNGSFVPEHCNPLFSVAILVTYRNRQSQLHVFLPYMHNFLRKQNIHYKIFLIEQQDNKPWNKGLLYNIGARHALLEKFPCLILHDVDLLPLNEGNLYACLQQPRHMSASIDKFRFVLPYAALVGGAAALRAAHFRAVGGLSNRFRGWGGEDDDLAARIADQGLQIQRFPRELSEYTMLVHRQEAKNRERERIMAENRRCARGEGLRGEGPRGEGVGLRGEGEGLRGEGEGRRGDGLHSLRYDSVRVTRERLVTLIAVQL